MILSFFKKQYDIPLHIKAGSHFTIWIISLMMFLCTFVLFGAMGVNNLTDQWKAGLENNLTIEIKPQIITRNGLPQIDLNSMNDLVAKIEAVLKAYQTIESFHVFSEKETIELLGSWSKTLINSETLHNEIPFPKLIAVSKKEGQTLDIQSLEKELNAISSDIIIDTHESWLGHLIHLTNQVQNIGLLLALLIGLTVLVAVIGSARSRLSMHWADIELLHLIGASDQYIAKQFARHGTRLTFIGSFLGCIPALLLLKTLSDNNSGSLFLSLSLTPIQWVLLWLLPVFSAIIAYWSTITAARKYLQNMV